MQICPIKRGSEFKQNIPLTFRFYIIFFLYLFPTGTR
jgi:hypothetical protein